MRDRLGFFLSRDLDHSFRDERTGNAGAEEILPFVNRAGLDHWKNEIARELFLEIVDVTFGSAGAQRFLFQTLEFFLLTNVRAERDDFGLIIFLEPAENDRRVEPARIREDNFHGKL